jgi:hypothetical protein
MRSAVRLFTGVDIQDSWKELEYCVRTGQPAFPQDVSGCRPVQPMASDPERAAVFDEAMAAFTPTAPRSPSRRRTTSPHRNDRRHRRRETARC